MIQGAITPAEVVAFWRDAGPKRWFRKDEAFDAAIRSRFEPAHMAAARGEFEGWAAEPDGALALLLLLDQFPRNLYRGSAHAFATDPLARRYAKAAIAAGLDDAIEAGLRGFFYLPLEHSEDAADQARAVELFIALGDAELLRYARLHAEVIDCFGSFPHRNAALGRETTPEEQAFLDQGGFAG